MPESYPLPSHAAHFWIAGDDLWIAFPGQGPEERGHSIRLPASAGGLAAAVKIMRDRATARDLKLSNPGTPTQYEIERALAHDAKYAHILGAMKQAKIMDEAERKEAAAELAELGL